MQAAVLSSSSSQQQHALRTAVFVPRRASKQSPGLDKIQRSYEKITSLLASVLKKQQEELAPAIYRQSLSGRDFNDELTKLAQIIVKVATTLYKRGRQLPFLQEIEHLSTYVPMHQKLLLDLHRAQEQNELLLKVYAMAQYAAKEMRQCNLFMKNKDDLDTKLENVGTLVTEFFDYGKRNIEQNNAQVTCVRLLYRDALIFFLYAVQSLQGDTSKKKSLVDALNKALCTQNQDQNQAKVVRDAHSVVEAYKRSFSGPVVASELLFKQESWLISWTQSYGLRYGSIYAIVEKITPTAQGITYMSQDIVKRLKAFNKKNFTPVRECKTLTEECALYTTALDDLKNELKAHKNDLLKLPYTDQVIDGLQYLAHLRMRIEEVRAHIALFSAISQNKTNELTHISKELLPLLRAFSQKDLNASFTLKDVKGFFKVLAMLASVSVKEDTAFAEKFAKTLYDILYTIVVQIGLQFEISKEDASLIEQIFEKQVDTLVDTQKNELSEKLKIYIVKRCIANLYFSEKAYDSGLDLVLYTVSQDPAFKNAYLQTVKNDEKFGSIIRTYADKTQSSQDNMELKTLAALRHCLLKLQSLDSDQEAEKLMDVYWFSQARKRLYDIERRAQSPRIQELVTSAKKELVAFHQAQKYPIYCMELKDTQETGFEVTKKFPPLYTAMLKALWPQFQNDAESVKGQQEMQPFLQSVLTNQEPFQNHIPVRLLLEEIALRKIHRYNTLTTEEHLCVEEFFKKYVTDTSVQKAFCSIHGVSYLEVALYKVYTTTDNDTLKEAVNNKPPLWKVLMQHYDEFQKNTAVEKGHIQNSEQHTACILCLDQVVQLAAIDEMQQNTRLKALGQWLEDKMKSDIIKFFPNKE